MNGKKGLGLKWNPGRAFAIMTCILCFVSAFAGEARAAESKTKPIVLKAITALRKGVVTTGFEMFMKRLNKDAQGRLVLKWTGGPEAIPAHDQAEALRGGVVDFAFVPPGYYKSQLPEASATFFSRLTPWEERKIGYYDLLVKLHEKAGWRYVGNGAWGPMYYLWTNFEAKKPEDISDHLIRSGRTSLAFVKALGAKPVTIPLRDVYSGLDRGIIEGGALGSYEILSSKFYEVLKYLIPYGFYNNRTGFLMNLDSWNRLPKDLQDLILQTQKNVDREIVDAFVALADECLKDILKKGVVETKFSPEDAKRYQELAYEVGWKGAYKKMKPENAEKIKKMLFGK